MKNKSSILIVDDQLSVREVFRGLLTGQNYNLVFAVDGQEALAKAAESTPDVVLLDVMMPDMDGFEVCRRLRATPLLAEVPIIMITALDDQQSRIQGIEAGADDFLTKPVNASELLARLKTTTQLNRYRRLLAERAKFDWVVEQANDGYLILADNDHILYANGQARLYLGLSTEENEPILASFLEITARQYHYEPELAWTTWPEPPPLTTDRVPRYLVQPASATADVFWLQVNTLALLADSTGGLIVHLQDVTPQMTLQREIWVFQTIISHKLRTPLAGLITGLDILKGEGLTELLDEEMNVLFEIVSRGATQLNQTIDGILQYIDVPALTKFGDTFNSLLLPQLVAQISTSLELKTVTVSNHITEDTAPLLFTEQALEVILREVLENTKKFHPQQTPTVEVSLSYLRDKQQVCIQISDDGSTPSPEQLAQVWTPYYQGERYFTGQMPGIGLGLAKVALLIWSVGGTCRLYNRKPGPGVTVELILPCA